MSSSRSYSLGIDLDNVTADYTNLLRNYMHREHGWLMEDMPEPTDYSWIESEGWNFQTIGQYLDIHNTMVRHGGFLEVELVNGAKETIDKLYNLDNISIDIITHRILGSDPQDKLQAVSDTCRWIFNKGIKHDNIAFYSDKKRVVVDCLIDDSPHNITSVRDNGGYVIVFDQPYNQHLDGPRAHNWDEVFQLVVEHKKRLGL